MTNTEILRNQRCRVILDIHPPWAFLRVFRYLEHLVVSRSAPCILSDGCVYGKPQFEKS